MTHWERREFWKNLDWTRTDQEIAEQEGFCEPYVRTMRKRHKKCPVRTPRVWDGVDWTQKNSVIASLVGHSESYVSQMRSKLGALASAYHPAPIHKKYLSLDWTKSDSELAREMGVSRERIGQRRDQLAPEGLKSPKRNIKPKSTLRSRIAKLEEENRRMKSWLEEMSKDRESLAITDSGE